MQGNDDERTLAVLREHGPLRRAELAKRTGIPPTTLLRHLRGRLRSEVDQDAEGHWRVADVEKRKGWLRTRLSQLAVNMLIESAGSWSGLRVWRMEREWRKRSAELQALELDDIGPD